MRKLLFLALLTACTTLNGQQLSKTFGFTYKANFSREILPYQDNYLVSFATICEAAINDKFCYGYSVIDKNGDTLQHNFIASASNEQEVHTPKNTINIVGDTIVFATNIAVANQKSYLKSYKFDGNGKLLKSNSYYFGNNVINFGTKKTKRGYIVHGELRKSNGKSFLYLLALNDNLDSVGFAEIGDICSTSYAVLEENSEADIVIARLYNCFGEYMELYCLDSALKVKWHIPEFFNFENFFSKTSDDLMDLKITKNDDIIFLCDYNNSNFFNFDSVIFPPLLTKFDKNGQIKWQKKLRTKFTKNSSNLQVYDNGDILITGITDYFTEFGINTYPFGYGSWVALYDSLGNPKWDRFIFDHRYPYGCLLSDGLRNPNGTYSFIGYVVDTLANIPQHVESSQLWYLTLDSNGCYNGDCKDVIIINKPNVGLKELNQAFHLKLFPNPASSEIQIELTLPTYDTPTEVAIVDVTGAVVQMQKIPDFAYLTTVDVSKLPSGVYGVQLRQMQKFGERVLAVEKLVVVR